MNDREILTKILSVDKEYLNSLEMFLDEEAKEKIKCFSLYYDALAGENHYRLLKYISTLYNKELLLDIGTCHGTSAFALAQNPENRVFSFDIYDHLLENKKYMEKHNIRFFLVDVLDMSERLTDTRFIMLDTFHDGLYEKKFYDELNKLNYKGLLFCDDIHLNDEMRSFWESINHEKYDLTDKGHDTGSGIVIFE